MTRHPYPHPHRMDGRLETYNRLVMGFTIGPARIVIFVTTRNRLHGGMGCGIMWVEMLEKENRSLSQRKEVRNESEGPKLDQYGALV